MMSLGGSKSYRSLRSAEPDQAPHLFDRTEMLMSHCFDADRSLRRISFAFPRLPRFMTGIR